MSFSPADQRYMERALALAEKCPYDTSPNPRVGCVIVKDGEIVGEGRTQVFGGPHAEPNALSQADDRASGSTIYVTLEPCAHFGKTPPCVDAVIAAAPGRVVVAMSDPNPKVAGKSLKLMRDHGIQVDVGLMEEQAKALNPGFIKRMQTGQPYVRCKMAMSLDGKTALASGESKWITGDAARADVQLWRARSDAIVTGIGTILADDPSMNARLADETRHPTRVIVDSHLRTPAGAKMLSLPGKTLIVTNSDSNHLTNVEELEVVRLPQNEIGKVNLAALLDDLVQRDYQEILVESGPTLAGKLLEQGLIDELIVYIAPVIFGSGARDAFSFGPIQNMAERIEFQIDSVTTIGEDIRIIAKKK